MDNRFLICCPLFPLLAFAGLGLGLSVWLFGSGLSEVGGGGVPGSNVSVSVQLVKGRTRFADSNG